jgi:regulator of RNase E activity RraA
VVTVPANIIEEIANEVSPMTIYEDYVIDKVRNGSAIKGLYPLTDENEKKTYEKWLKNNSEEN